MNLRVPNVYQRQDPIATMRQWLNGEPVWSHDEILKCWGSEFLMHRIAWERGEHVMCPSVDRTTELHKLRDEAIREFGFPIPCRELLDALERHQPILEIGAGTGYLTALMRMHGIDVLSTDPALEEFQFTVGRYDPIQHKLQGKTAIRRYRYPDRTVFCSWPSLHHTWFRQALRAMRIGQKAIIVEEDACAEETTWDYRDNTFDRLECIPLPAWNYLNDRAAVWVKRRGKCLT